MNRAAEVNAWLVEHGHLPDLEAMAARDPLSEVAEAIRAIIEEQAPELAEGAPWLALADAFAHAGDAVLIVADTERGFAVCDLGTLPPGVEYLEPADFIAAVDTITEGERIAATFAAEDERLTWLEAEFGIQGALPLP